MVFTELKDLLIVGSIFMLPKIELWVASNGEMYHPLLSDVYFLFGNSDAHVVISLDRDGYGEFPILVRRFCCMYPIICMEEVSMSRWTLVIWGKKWRRRWKQCDWRMMG